MKDENVVLTSFDHLVDLVEVMKVIEFVRLHVNVSFFVHHFHYDHQENVENVFDLHEGIHFDDDDDLKKEDHFERKRDEFIGLPRGEPDFDRL